jgi:3-methyladenine DNA glycosylase AlkD
MNRQNKRAFQEVLGEIEELNVANVPSLRRIRKTLSARLKDASPESVRWFAEQLKTSGRRWMGYEIIEHHPATSASLKLRDVEGLGSGMSSWDEVDTFCASIAGPAWVNGRISDAAVRRWAQSPDVWWRRAALVATTAFNVRARGGTGDTKRTLDIAERLVADREDMVVKAMSWALRHLIYFDRDAVVKFLKKHDAQIAPRVKREVGNKLNTGLKNP